MLRLVTAAAALATFALAHDIAEPVGPDCHTHCPDSVTPQAHLQGHLCTSGSVPVEGAFEIFKGGAGRKWGGRYDTPRWY